ncbi:MAG TPA: cupin domain-containing protein [Allosphingosinicella sp.]|nr:cupin domain-containing protein [Allosphingosinicella sp.]
MISQTLEDGMDRPELIKAAQAEAKAALHSHPWNPKSEMIGVQLGRLAGLERVGVSLARIPPGKESFVYHSHEREEEWLYILSGTATAEIDGADFEVGPGDFMGFPTPSLAHHLRNTGSEDLLYLMGGENRDLEIADFPKLGKRMVRSGDKVEIYDIEDAKPFGPL